VLSECAAIDEIIYLDVNASMNNGGGPACLRLRVSMTAIERAAVKSRVFAEEGLFDDLETWVHKHYRDRLRLEDLADPQLLEETRRALDELTQILQLGSLYDFQRNPGDPPCP
jgi:succinylarginine dihydrolase